jgi:chorismate dehydratase
VREGVDLENVEQAFHRAKAFGLARSGAIAQREAPGQHVDPGYVRRYLAHIIHYDLGPRELAGLRHYYALAADLGLAPAGVDLVSYHRPHLVESR